MKTLQVLNFRNLHGSGVTESVPALCEGLVKEGADVSLFVPRARQEWQKRSFSLHVHSSLNGFHWLGLSPSMHRGLILASKQADVIHCHDMWTMSGVYASWAAEKAKCRSVISPRGSLSPAARQFSKWKKRAMWRLLRARTVRHAHCLHVTADQEYREIREAGLRNPVAIIPNGVDLPSMPSTESRKSNDDGRRRMLFLARIHAKKGVDVLLRAWQQVQREFPEWELQIAGPDDHGYLPRMKRLAQSLRLERAAFLGPVYGEAKTSLLHQADAYVLPTRSENFGLTVAEALAHGVPAIVTDGAPWSGLVTEQCGWWIERGDEALVACFREAMGLSRQSLCEMGERGREWVRRDFGREAVSRRMMATYEWLVGGGQPPAWVILN